MKHIGTKKLETEHLVLRRFVLCDVEALYNNWMNDPEVVKYMRMPPHKTENDTRCFVQCIIGNYDKADTYRWCVVLKETSEPIGFIGLTVLNEYDCTGDFGYSIGKPFWNRGYTSEALTAVLQ